MQINLTLALFVSFSFDFLREKSIVKYNNMSWVIHKILECLDLYVHTLISLRLKIHRTKGFFFYIQNVLWIKKFTYNKYLLLSEVVILESCEGDYYTFSFCFVFFKSSRFQGERRKKKLSKVQKAIFQEKKEWIRYWNCNRKIIYLLVFPCKKENRKKYIWNIK